MRIKRNITNINSSSSAQQLILSIARTKSVPEQGVKLKKLHDLGYTYDEISYAVGMSVSTIVSRVKIANLEPLIQEYFAKGAIPSDYTVVNAIANLADDVRVKIATELGEARALRADVLKACGCPSRYDKASKPVYTKSGTKNLDLHLVDEGAKQVCKRCTLHDCRSATMCKGCSAIELVNWIKKTVEVPA